MHRAALNLAAGANRVELIKSTLQLFRRCEIELSACPQRHRPHARPDRVCELLNLLADPRPLGTARHQMLPLSSLFKPYPEQSSDQDPSPIGHSR